MIFYHSKLAYFSQNQTRNVVPCLAQYMLWGLSCWLLAWNSMLMAWTALCNVLACYRNVGLVPILEKYEKRREKQALLLCSGFLAGVSRRREGKEKKRKEKEKANPTTWHIGHVAWIPRYFLLLWDVLPDASFHIKTRCPMRYPVGTVPLVISMI